MSEMKNTQNQAQKKEEIAIKFGKGLAQTFTGKDGKEYMRIQIPNMDPKDKSPWQSFVVPAKSVHENQFGKGLWIKVPLDGSTTVSRNVRVGYDDNGKSQYETQKRSVPNTELKTMVEFYKAEERAQTIGQGAIDHSKPKKQHSYGMDR